MAHLYHYIVKRKLIAGVHVITRQWAKITEPLIYCDTARLSEVLTALHQQGVSQAAATPITT